MVVLEGKISRVYNPAQKHSAGFLFFFLSSIEVTMHGTTTKAHFDLTRLPYKIIEASPTKL